MMISCDGEKSLPGIFPEFIGTNHMNKGFPGLYPGFIKTNHMNKGIPM